MSQESKPEKPIRVLVVEDEERILRNQLKLLKGYPELEIVGSSTSGPEAVRMAEELRPDVILLDLGLPEMDGIQVTEQVRKNLAGVEVLIFTIFEEEEKVMAAIQAGASGYLLKGASADRIVDAIREVNDGGSVVQPSLARRLLRHFRPDPSGAEPTATLTPREQDILGLIAKGMSNPEVARVLSLSRSTVRTHLEHIYAKLDVSNRTEAVTEGLKQGLIEL